MNKNYEIRKVERYQLIEISEDRETLMIEGTKEECEKYREERTKVENIKI